MREKLEQMLYHRSIFQGTYEVTGKCGKKTPTVLLKDIYCHGNYVADHVWLLKTRTMTNMHLKQGDIVEFVAVVRPYTKKDGTNDYTLDCPRHIKKIHSTYSPKKGKYKKGE